MPGADVKDQDQEQSKAGKLDEVMVFDMGSGLKKPPPTLGQRKTSSQRADGGDKAKKEFQPDVEVLVSEKDHKKYMEQQMKAQEKANKELERYKKMIDKILEEDTTAEKRPNKSRIGSRAQR